MKYWRTPLDVDQKRPPHGRVHIIIERCKGCGFCIAFCPNQLLEASPEFNRHGYHPPVIVHPERCGNCTFCQVICPEFAIWTTPEDESQSAKQAQPPESRPQTPPPEPSSDEK